MGNRQTETGPTTGAFKWLALGFTLVCVAFAGAAFVLGRETGAFWTGLAMLPIVGLMWVTIRQRWVSPGFERDAYFVATTLLVVGLYRTGDWFLVNYIALMTMALVWMSLQLLPDEDPQELS